MMENCQLILEHAPVTPCWEPIEVTKQKKQLQTIDLLPRVQPLLRRNIDVMYIFFMILKLGIL